MIYTHDSGLVIRVDQFDQQIEFDAGRVIGPFEPLDVDLTCAAIAEEALRTNRFDWLSAASEWRRLNVEAELSREEDVEEETYGWTWH